jgi:curved DNA-binding protein CbpA
VHDYFEILGVSPQADTREVRQAGRRRRASLHPDYSDSEPADLPIAAPAGDDAIPDVASVDAAIDFVNMRTIVARMQAAFFGPHAPAR